VPNYICITCGNQYSASDEAPRRCLICDEERQYVNPEGQTWVLHNDLEQSHHNEIRTLEPGLSEIETAPKFAIGQRALLVETPKGNVLWDCVSLIDKASIKEIEALGGISALAMSHPHMFGSMVEWSRAFGNAPIYLHADFEKWMQRPDPLINYWAGESFELEQGVSLQRCGGHFKGQTILHWPDAANGKGAIFGSDALYVTADRKYVGFMYSYPNYIPLSAKAVTRIGETVSPLNFDRIYSHFRYRQILSGGKEIINKSIDRYLNILNN
jgi:hypothetical protein